MAPTRQLDSVEIRVLGALLEKEQTTPELYPLTVSALLAACNQKTNREPVTRLSETQVVDALERLRHEVLVWRSAGARAERWEHRLDRRWHLGPAAKAVVTLLLLRGPQTPGELRARSERMHCFAGVGEVTAVLEHLAGGAEPLVVELARRPGQKEARWGHTAGESGTSGPLPQVAEPEAPAPAAESPSVGTTPDGLEARLEALEGRVAEIAAELRALREELGDAPPLLDP